MKNLHVLITNVSYQAAISFIKMLRSSRKYNCYIVGIDDKDKGYCSASILVDKYIKILVNTNKTEYKKIILDISSSENIDLILSAEETDLLLFKEMKLKSSKYEYIPQKYIFELFKDKTLANHQIKKLGIDVPETICNINDLKKHKKIIRRKNNSCCSRGISIFNSSEINADYDFLSKVFFTQEFIAGREYVVDVLCDKNGLPIFFIPRIILSAKDGTDFIVQIEQNPNLVELCKIVYAEYKIPGISNIQFMYSKGKYYFIELNVRASASIITSSIASANILDIYIEHFVYNKECLSYLDFENKIKYNKVIARYYEETIYEGIHDE